MRQTTKIKVLFILLITLFGQIKSISQTSQKDTPLLVHHCIDFSVTGKADNAEWQNASWINLNKIDKAGDNYESKFKILYSDKGIYVLFSGKDNKITSDYKNDFDDLFNADVFEVFFHTDTTMPLYFEYEISPLEKELALLIINNQGRIAGWAPWHYDTARKVIKKVNIIGGEMKAGASIKQWTAELFFPFALIEPLGNVPPVSGTKWNANFCRLDYDSGSMVKWSWSPIKISFHEIGHYLPIMFE